MGQWRIRFRGTAVPGTRSWDLEVGSRSVAQVALPRTEAPGQVGPFITRCDAQWEGGGAADRPGSTWVRWLMPKEMFLPWMEG